MIPAGVGHWFEKHGYGPVVSNRAVGGGCINNGMVLKTAGGKTFFLKTNRQAPADMFAREAEGLAELRAGDGPRLPEPFVWGEDYLLLEDLSPASQRSGYWTDFGRQMALLHNRTAPRFGFYHDNYIGSTPQPNSWTGDGFEFFAQHRLVYQARLAFERGQMGRGEVRQVEQLAGRLRELVPDQPASLIHGDLWTGNALSDEQGKPAIIDPAAYYGWAEADLAMTTLFGSFPNDFYQAYQEVRRLDDGFRSRFPIYNLYHLLNHLNLFGESYLGSVQQVLSRFSD